MKRFYPSNHSLHFRGVLQVDFRILWACKSIRMLRISELDLSDLQPEDTQNKREFTLQRTEVQGLRR